MCFCTSSNMKFRWRTELDLNSGKSLDHNHRTTAQRTRPERSRLASRIRVSGWQEWSREAGRKPLFAQRNQCTTAATREEAEVSNADEAARQHMQQEAA